MPKVKIPIFGTVGKSITFDTGATAGATVGKNLFNADGSLVVVDPSLDAVVRVDPVTGDRTIL